MKFLIALALIAVVAAKSELKFKNTCADPMVRVENIDDEKSGAVTMESVLLIDVNTREDTWGKDPFDEFTEMKIYKWLFVKYVKVPNALLGLVCKKVASDFKGKVICMGSGPNGGYKVNIPCTFKDILGHCLPGAGKTHVRFPIKPPMQPILNMFNSIFAGWVKVSMVSTSPVSDTELACVEAEAKIDL